MSAAAGEAQRGDETRAAIIAAARTLFVEQGMNATTVRQIADRAHVSIGSVYVHFAGKADLMLQFVTEGLDALERDLTAARDHESPIARVKAAGDAYLAFTIQHPVAARYTAIRALEPDTSPEFAELNRVLSARVRRLVLMVAEDVRAAMSADEIPTTPMEDTMIFLWALWNGTAALMLRQDGLALPPAAAQRGIDFGRSMLRLANGARRAGAS